VLLFHVENSALFLPPFLSHPSFRPMLFTVASRRDCTTHASRNVLPHIVPHMLVAMHYHIRTRLAAHHWTIGPFLSPPVNRATAARSDHITFADSLNFKDFTQHHSPPRVTPDTHTTVALGLEISAISLSASYTSYPTTLNTDTSRCTRARKIFRGKTRRRWWAWWTLRRGRRTISRSTSFPRPRSSSSTSWQTRKSTAKRQAGWLSGRKRATRSSARQTGRFF
jgi:hypothetical protein